MSDPENAELSTLEQLASKKFGELTEAEKKFLRAAAVGGVAYCGPLGEGPDAQQNAPAQANNWGSERHIRAKLIAWLCIDRDASKLVHAKGLNVACAKIIAKLDLSTVRMQFPLIFFQCCFSQVFIVHSDLILLSLDGCLVGPGSNDHVAINADSLRARTMFLRRGFHAMGRVNLRGAEIAGNLECDGGRIVNLTGTALSLNAARIGGSVFLRNGFIAEGEVDLAGVQIGIGLDCSNAQFKNAEAMAFTANDAKIECKVDFSGVAVTGEVSLVAAEVGTDLAIDRADLTNATLRVQRARIKGGFFARKTLFGTAGFMDLGGASASHVDDDPESWPSRDHVDLDGFLYGYLRRPDDALRRLDLLGRQSLTGTEGSDNRHVRAQPYRHLAKVLREMGYEKEGRKALFGLEQERDRRENFGRREKLLRWLYRRVLGYGYEPHKPASVLGVLVFLIGWIFVSLGNTAGLIIPVSELTPPGAVVHAQPRQLSPMLYSLDALLPIHAFRQEENWWPRAEVWRWCICPPTALPWGYVLRLWLCCQILAGWILTGVIVAGLAGVVRRE